MSGLGFDDAKATPKYRVTLDHASQQVNRAVKFFDKIHMLFRTRSL